MALQKIALMAVLLVNPVNLEKQYNKINHITHQIKLSAYSGKDPKEIVDEIQKLVIKLSVEVE